MYLLIHPFNFHAIYEICPICFDDIYVFTTKTIKYNANFFFR